MSEARIIYPCPGAVVRIPEDNFRFLSEQGERVIWNTHWARAHLRREICFEPPIMAEDPANTANQNVAMLDAGSADPAEDAVERGALRRAPGRRQR